MNYRTLGIATFVYKVIVNPSTSEEALNILENLGLDSGDVLEFLHDNMSLESYDEEGLEKLLEVIQ